MYKEENRKLLEKKAEVLKAIGHPARLCILSCLLENEGCNVSLLIEKMCLPQSTISQHISKLKSQDIIYGVRNGLEIKYTVIDEDVVNVLKYLLKDLTNERGIEN